MAGYTQQINGMLVDGQMQPIPAPGSTVLVPVGISSGPDTLVQLYLEGRIPWKSLSPEARARVVDPDAMSIALKIWREAPAAHKDSGVGLVPVDLHPPPLELGTAIPHSTQKGRDTGEPQITPVDMSGLNRPFAGTVYRAPCVPSFRSNTHGL